MEICYQFKKKAASQDAARSGSVVFVLSVSQTAALPVIILLAVAKAIVFADVIRIVRGCVGRAPEVFIYGELTLAFQLFPKKITKICSGKNTAGKHRRRGKLVHRAFFAMAGLGMTKHNTFSLIIVR